MHTSPIFVRARGTIGGLPFSYALLLAIALNFLCADGHDQQRCIELVVLAIGLLGSLVTGQLTRALQAVPLGLRGVGLAFLALGACATIGTLSPGHALAEWSMFIVLGLSAIVVGDEFAVANATAGYRFVQLLGLGCGLYCLRVLLVYGAAIAAGTPLHFQSLGVGFSNIRFLNHAQTALLPLLALLIVVSKRERWTRYAAFLVTSYWWSLIFYAESRATMLALAAGMTVTWVVRGRYAKPLLVAMLTTAVAGVILYLLLYFLIPVAAGLKAYGLSSDMLGRTAADPISGRQFLWRRAADLILHHPILGVGPQHFAHFGADLATGAHPHDWLLQIASEWGLPALLCVLFLLGTGIHCLVLAGKSVPAADKHNQAICATLFVALIAIVVDSLFSGVLVMPQSQMSLVLVTGIAIGWTRSLRQASVAHASVATRTAGAALALSALCILTFIVGPDAARKWDDEPLTPLEQAHNPHVHWPRLWEAGFF